MLKATEVTIPKCPSRVTISVLVSMFQSFIVLSADELARIVPVLLKVIEVIFPVCPYKLANYLSIFQKII